MLELMASIGEHWFTSESRLLEVSAYFLQSVASQAHVRQRLLELAKHHNAAIGAWSATTLRGAADALQEVASEPQLRRALQLTHNQQPSARRVAVHALRAESKIRLCWSDFYGYWPTETPKFKMTLLSASVIGKGRYLAAYCGA